MKFLIFILIYFSLISNSFAQDKEKDFLVANDYAMCSIVFKRLYQFVGVFQSKNPELIPNLNSVEIKFIKDKPIDVLKTYIYFFEFNRMMLKGFKSIHDYYSVADAEHAMSKMSMSFEEGGKKQWVNKINIDDFFNDYYEKTVKCMFMAETLKNVEKLTKKNTLILHDSAIKMFVDFKKTPSYLNDSGQVKMLLKFGFIVWEASDFETAEDDYLSSSKSRILKNK
jgi:hypothetical protein